MGAFTQTEAAPTGSASRFSSRGDKLADVVADVARSYAWVTPLGPVPFEMKAKLSEMNLEMRASEAEVGRQFCGGVTDDLIFVALSDIEEDGLALKKGMIVLFRIYQDNRGVQGCMVTSS